MMPHHMAELACWEPEDAEAPRRWSRGDAMVLVLLGSALGWAAALAAASWIWSALA